MQACFRFSGSLPRRLRVHLCQCRAFKLPDECQVAQLVPCRLYQYLVLDCVYPRSQVVDGLALPALDLPHDEGLTSVDLLDDLVDHDAGVRDFARLEGVPRALYRVRPVKLPGQGRVEVEDADAGADERVEEVLREDVHEPGEDDEVRLVVQDAGREEGVVVGARLAWVRLCVGEEREDVRGDVGRGCALEAVRVLAVREDETYGEGCVYEGLQVASCDASEDEA